MSIFCQSFPRHAYLHKGVPWFGQIENSFRTRVLEKPLPLFYLPRSKVLESFLQNCEEQLKESLLVTLSNEYSTRGICAPALKLSLIGVTTEADHAHR